MASRGYYFDTVDGRHFAVPSPGVLLCPARCQEVGCNDFPLWLVEFTRGDLWYFRRFGEYPTYSLEKIGDGTFEFRDVDIDTVMYTMAPTYNSAGSFDGYAVTWKEHVSDSQPSKCDLDGDCILPVTDDADVWGEFKIDLQNLVFPVYKLVYTQMEVTEGAGEEDVVEYNVEYLLDVCFEPERMLSCSLWGYESQDQVVEFRFNEGKYDTQHRRLYPLSLVGCTVSFDDDGFVLYDGDGDRIGNAARYVHEDDEGFNDGWGLDALSGLAFETYLDWYGGDTRRWKSTGTRTDIWNDTLALLENPLDKIMCIIRMALDAKLEMETYTWPVEMPMNYKRVVNGADVEIVKTKSGWDVVADGKTKYTVKFSGDWSEGTWNFYGTDGSLVYVLGSVGDGTFSFKSASGSHIHTVCVEDSYEPTGEYSQENLYPELVVKDSDGLVVYTIDRPVKCDDPFEASTFAEFVDSIPLRKVDGAWIDYSGNPYYFVSQSENVNYWQDIYNKRNTLSYRVSKPSELDTADREVYDTDGNKVAVWKESSLASAATGSTIAKMYADPDALYTYQLFDNASGAYQYLSHYSNDMVVVVDSKGDVVSYVMPSGEYRDSKWHLVGLVTAGNKVVDEEYNTLFTFKQNAGDYNLYDVDGNLIGHLYSSSTPNNEWVIGEGMQRLFTFLATETKAVIGSDGSYVFVDEEGTLFRSKVKIQAESTGVLVLTVLDEDGEEMYRITASGGTYQVNAANGVAFDTAKSYETYAQGNMVLTRYWSTPYNRMMYSCTNDQPEGSFDDIIWGSGNSSSSGAVPLGLAVGSGSVWSLSDTNSGVLSDAGTPRTLAAVDSASSDSGEGLGTPDAIQDLIDSMSDFYDGVNGILAKDTNTSKGDDLDPDNPLAMAQAETDGRSIADAAFAGSLTAAEQQALTDAYDYTQAITRVSKMYSLGRADIYKEAQDYAETRTKRIEAKKAAFASVLEKSKERAQRESG